MKNKELTMLRETVQMSHDHILCLFDELDEIFEEMGLLPSSKNQVSTYEKWESVRDEYREENPWIEDYEDKPRMNMASIPQIKIQKCFDRYFGVQFDSTYEDWNRNFVTGLRLELDGYNAEKKIAYEYNGEFYHHTDDQKFKDECKRVNCLENGVKLYVVTRADIDIKSYADEEELYVAVCKFIEKN